MGAAAVVVGVAVVVVVAAVVVVVVARQCARQAYGVSAGMPVLWRIDAYNLILSPWISTA